MLLRLESLPKVVHVVDSGVGDQPANFDRPRRRDEVAGKACRLVLLQRELVEVVVRGDIGELCETVAQLVDSGSGDRWRRGSRSRND
jgi:hypothetical protein